MQNKKIILKNNSGLKLTMLAAVLNSYVPVTEARGLHLANKG